jgi:uncharacterized protein (DUF2147 family)
MCRLALFLAVPMISLTGRPARPQARASPVGFWNTIDDEDHRATAVVEIRQVGNELTGVVRGLLVPATHDDSICRKCTGERHDQPIVGMEILSHMRRDGDAWSGGEILDPENGKTYRARMKLTDDGKKLVLRGYLGISLFGRSQTWIRR